MGTSEDAMERILREQAARRRLRLAPRPEDRKREAIEAARRRWGLPTT